MHDLLRLLRYLKPHWPFFTLATFAMLLVGLLESAIGALIVPIFDQAFVQGAGTRTATLFGLQKINYTYRRLFASRHTNPQLIYVRG